MPIELWGSDIFTETCNAFRPVAETSIPTFIREAYGLMDPHVHQSCGFEANSRNFRVDGCIVKRLGGAEEVIKEQLRIYQYLQSCGIYIPEIIPHTEGEMSLAYEGAIWVVMEYIDGHFYAGTHAELEQVTTLLPALFAALRLYDSPCLSILPQRPYLTSPMIPTQSIHLLRHDIQELLQESMPDLRIFLSQILAEMPALVAQPRLVHIDLHPRNILVKGQRLYLLDFDSLQFQSDEIAYNFAVYKILRRCRVDKIDAIPYRDALFVSDTIKNNPNAAQAEIMFRLVSILAASSPGNLSVWEALIPVHLRGLYEAMELC